MSWPTAPIDTDALDQDSDSLIAAREQIIATTQAVNAIIASRGTAGGIASVDGDGYIPEPLISGQSVLNVLLDVDGVDSGLDADLFQGLTPANFVLAEWATINDALNPGYSSIARSSSLTTTMRTNLSLDHTTSGTAAAGFGVGLRYQLENAGGVLTRAVELSTIWTVATNGSESGAFVISGVDAGTFQEQARFVNRLFVMKERSAPSGSPAAGDRWLYPKSDGWYEKDSGGTEVKLSGGSGGITDHGGLTGLSDDDHSIYLLASGARAMSGDLALGAHGILYTDQGSDPSSPSAGTHIVYAKSGGIYVKDSSGTVTGPFGASGLTDHNALSNLTTGDAHTQYLLRQPTADVVINDSGADFDFRIEGDTAQNLFRTNAGANTVGINCDPSTNARLVVDGTSDYGAGYFSSTNALNYTVQVVGIQGLSALASSSGNGTAIYASRDHTGSNPIVKFAHTLSSAQTGELLLLSHSAQTSSIVLRAKVGASLSDVFSVYTDGVVINEAGLGSFDVRMEGDTATNLFFLDTSEDKVNINGSLTNARLNVTGGSIGAIYATSSAGAGGGVITVAGSGGAAALRATMTGTGLGLDVSVTTAQAMIVSRAATGAPVFQPLAQIQGLEPTDTLTLLELSHAGTGAIIDGIGPDSLSVWALMGSGATRHLILDDPPTAPDSGYFNLIWLADGPYMQSASSVLTPLFGSGAGLPTGTVNQTIRHNGSSYESTSVWTVESAAVRFTPGATGARVSVPTPARFTFNNSNGWSQAASGLSIPIGAFVIGVVPAVLDLVTGPSAIDIGTTDNVEMFYRGAAVSEGATDPDGTLTMTSGFHWTAEMEASTITIRDAAAPGTTPTGGEVAVLFYYIEMAAPTS